MRGLTKPTTLTSGPTLPLSMHFTFSDTARFVNYLSDRVMMSFSVPWAPQVYCNCTGEKKSFSSYLQKETPKPHQIWWINIYCLMQLMCSETFQAIIINIQSSFGTFFHDASHKSELLWQWQRALKWRGQPRRALGEQKVNRLPQLIRLLIEEPVTSGPISHGTGPTH